MKHISILLLILLLIACVPATQTEPGGAEPTPTSGYDFSGVHLRLRNLSGRDFEDVELAIGGQTEQIGPLPQATASDYYTFTAVQQAPTIRAASGENVYEWTAEPAAAEGFIAGGEFTLELTIENNEFSVLFLMENPILQDAQYYADEMGVSLEEAMARLDTQSEDAISNLNNQLQANEADTFAGLWIQHEPEYRVVAAFTHDGEETIRKYIADDSELAQLIEVRPAQYTYEQLQADQQAVLSILDTIQLPVAVGIMVMENRVELDITDRAAFDAALAEANATLPESVIVVTTYEPVGDNPPFAITPVPDVFMPQLKMRDVGFMDALISGELVVQDGCLRVKAGDGSTLVIWQADYFLTDNDGILEILDETGAVVARVGEMVYMGGGEQPSVDDTELRQPIPDQCGGPYWRMGDFLPEEYIPNVSADLPLLTHAYDGWETGFAFDYPVRWQMNDMGFDKEGVTAVLTSRPMPTDSFEPFQPGDEMATLLFMPFTEPGDEAAFSSHGMLTAMEQYAAVLPPDQEIVMPPHVLSLDNRPTAAMVYRGEQEDTAVETYFVMTADSDHFIWVMGITPVGENWQLRPKIQALINSLQPVSYDTWRLYTIPDDNLSFAYPANWYVHEGMKALQITPNSQPIWSSLSDPNRSNDGPYFDFLHNLNRQMAETPLTEVENLLRGYEGEIEAIEPAAPLVSRPDVVIGAYRFASDEDKMALLIGAVANPVKDSPQPVVALISVVEFDELDTMQPIFEAVLRTVRPADAPPILDVQP